MGILDAPAADWRSKPLAGFHSKRDLFGTTVLDFDASAFKQTTGTVISRWSDESGLGANLGVPAGTPTIKQAGLAGLPTVVLPAGAYFRSSEFANFAGGAAAWGQPTSIAQPYTYIAVVKLDTSNNNATTKALLVGGSGGSTASLLLNGTAELQINAGGSGATGGPVPADGLWHIVVAHFGANEGWVMMDGVLVATATTQSHGANPIAQFAIGANRDGGLPLSGSEWARVLVTTGRMSKAYAASISRSLASTYNLRTEFPDQPGMISWTDVTDSGGQAMRVFLPPTRLIGSTVKVVVVNHQQNGTTNITPDFFAYPFIHTLCTAGYVVTFSNNHGIDGWTGTASETDMANARAWVAANIAPVASTVVIGFSMGGSLAAIAAKDMVISDLKGVYLIDAAVNLAWMYAHGYTGSINNGLGCTSGTLSAATLAGATSLTASVSIPAGTKVIIDPTGTSPETVTTTSVSGSASPYTIGVPALSFAHASGVVISDYPVKSIGKDPCLLTGAQLPQGIRWRSLSSSTDVTVLKTTNTDVFVPIIAASNPLENGSITHPDGHIAKGASLPLDVLDFVNRCFS